MSGSRERPILFSGPMVRAILEGRKTQTRRVLKPQPEQAPNGSWHVRNAHGGCIGVAEADIGRVAVDYQRFETGMTLWVREGARRNPHVWIYDADGTEIAWPGRGDIAGYKRDAMPSIHLPRSCSRLTLEVLSVKVERLQDISEEDARAEGVERDTEPCDHHRQSCADIGCLGPTYKASFCELWSEINGRASWKANPWVVAVAFRRIQQARAA